MTSDAPFRALVAGGGPAAIEAVLTLRDIAPAIGVTMLVPDRCYRYRPMSTVAPFAHGEVREYDLGELEDLGVTMRRDALRRVDPRARVVATNGGDALGYDALLIAIGARQRRMVPRAMTFEGPGHVQAMHGLLRDIEDGYTRSVTFVAPRGSSWVLPLYELALQTAERASAVSPGAVRLTLVTEESRPLELFGPAASDLVARLMRACAVEFQSGGTPPKADRTVALPISVGPHVPGLPADGEGFLPVDEYGRAAGAAGVWGAGDGTSQPIKQGGLATQQAETAARSIAVAAGLAVEAPPFRPELRALLVTGRAAWYLHRPFDDPAATVISEKPLWAPPTKIAGRRLGPFLDAIDAATPRANRFERRVAALPAHRPGARS
jgi:sulfide:quinone oxidoreductase